MAVHPAVALAVAPGPIGIQPSQSFRDNPLFLVLAMPERTPRVQHHLVSANKVIAGTLVETFAECILHRFQGQSGFFLSALVIGSPRSEALALLSHTAPSNSGCSGNESPRMSSPCI